MVRTEVEKVARIEGGFVLVPVAELMHAWHASRSAPLGIADFRTWLACREMVARRGMPQDGRIASYSHSELSKLLGITERRARASAGRLEAVGLIRWSEAAIEFPGQALGDEEKVRETIGRGKGAVALPRRMLRFLVSGGRPAMIATAIGVLLRCLSRRRGGWSSRGRVKASWLAETFGIGIRQVKAARVELAQLGWIEPEPSDAWAERKWGRAYRVNLDWSPKATEDGPTLTPQPARTGSTLTPADLQTRNPSGREIHQEPRPEPAGASLGREREISKAPAAPVTLRPQQASPGEGYRGDPPLPAPTLADVKLEDLRDDERLLELHRQAVARKLVGPSEADRLRFATSAEHALAVGKANPAGLFAYLVRNRAWRYLTGEDEDRAVKRFNSHGRSMIVDRSCVSSVGHPRPNDGLSEDARFVKAMREMTIRAGIYRDPFPTVQARDPRWNRERWDRAMVELGLA